VKNRVFMLGPILAARISSPEEGTIGGRIVGRCASASVTLADGTTLPLIGGTSVAHQDRSDLEVTFAPAGAIAAGLMRACDCFQQRALAGRERRVPALDCAPRLSLRRPPPLSRRRKAGEALVGERLAACVNIRSG